MAGLGSARVMLTPRCLSPWRGEPSAADGASVAPGRKTCSRRRPWPDPPGGSGEGAARRGARRTEPSRQAAKRALDPRGRSGIPRPPPGSGQQAAPPRTPGRARGRLGAGGAPPALSPPQECWRGSGVEGRRVVRSAWRSPAEEVTLKSPFFCCCFGWMRELRSVLRSRPKGPAAAHRTAGSAAGPPRSSARGNRALLSPPPPLPLKATHGFCCSFPGGRGEQYALISRLDHSSSSPVVITAAFCQGAKQPPIRCPLRCPFREQMLEMDL